MRAPMGMPKGDPEFSQKVTICLMIWGFVFAILLALDIKVFGGMIARIWLSLLLVVFGLFLIYCVVGIIIYQLYSHFPIKYGKLPKWIRFLSEKYIL